MRAIEIPTPVHRIPRKDSGGQLTRALTVPVSEVMSRRVLCVSWDVSVETLITLLLDQGVSGAPVLEDGQLVGFVTLADVLSQREDDGGTEEEAPPRARTRGGIAYELGPGFHTTLLARSSVAEIMTPAPLSVTPQTPLAEAAALMASRRLRQITVATPNRTVVGILSALDVTRWLAREHGYQVGER